MNALLFIKIENVFWVGCMSEQQGYKGLSGKKTLTGEKTTRFDWII